jgi:hypothetical protein
VTILQSLFGGRSQRQREALIDLLLMSAYADGEASRTDFDRIARAIETHEELKGFDWDEVRARAARIKDDGPLFFDTRERLAKDLADPELRRFGLGLAARFCGTQLGQEEQALLHQLAESFDIAEEDRGEILQPWTDADPFRMGYLRCSFNDPDATQQPTWVEALAKAEGLDELALLTFKATAARAAMSRLSEEAELVSVGEVVEIAGGKLRVDAYLRDKERSFLARFLAKDEALYPREHDLLPNLLERMDSSVSIYIGYAETLAPPDQSALALLEPERLLLQKLGE